MILTNERISTILGTFILFKKLPESNELLKLRKDLDIILTHGDDSDISGTELCDEIQSIKTFTFRRSKFSVKIFAVFENK
jgi:hypothetical protein